MSCLPSPHITGGTATPAAVSCMALGLTAALACASSAHANSYTIMELGKHQYPVAINKKGNVAGNRESSLSSLERAEVYRGEHWHVFPPGEKDSFATAINFGGDVVGQVAGAPTKWPRSNELVALPLPAGVSSSTPTGIADDGTIVGWFSTPGDGYSNCFRIDPTGNLENLGLMEGGNQCTARAVNRVGQVIGAANTVHSIPHAFIWQEGTFTDLGVLSAGTQSAALAINNGGHVVGYGDAGGPNQAFLWRDGKMRQIGFSLEFPNTYATAINDHGEIVGHGFRADFKARAVRFVDGNVIALESEVVNPDQWILDRATGINEDGVIVGWGHYKGKKTGFMLVPVSGN
jgi:probable HAF family extracellular repeat protein